MLFLYNLKITNLALIALKHYWIARIKYICPVLTRLAANIFEKFYFSAFQRGAIPFYDIINSAVRKAIIYEDENLNI